MGILLSSYSVFKRAELISVSPPTAHLHASYLHLKVSSGDVNLAIVRIRELRTLFLRSKWHLVTWHVVTTPWHCMMSRCLNDMLSQPRDMWRVTILTWCMTSRTGRHTDTASAWSRGVTITPVILFFPTSCPIYAVQYSTGVQNQLHNCPPYWTVQYSCRELVSKPCLMLYSTGVQMYRTGL